MQRLSLAILLLLLMAAAGLAESLVTPEYAYTGGMRHGTPNGYGEARYANGTRYNGFWADGKRDGLGRMLYTDGTFEFGLWKKGVYQHVKGQKFIPGIRCYGIDVSKYQKTIVWEKLSLKANAAGEVVPSARNARYMQPVLFALIKSTQGTTVRDPTFTHNFAEAHRCGIIRGAYHFLSIYSTAAAQARYFIENTTLETGDLPPVLDLEIDKATMQKNHDKVVKMAKEWLRIVEQHYGVKPIVYTYNNYYIDYLHGHGLDGYDYWIARYGARPTARQWEIWQFTETGRAAGINHAVDINVFRGTYRDLEMYIKQKGIHRNYGLSRHPASYTNISRITASQRSQLSSGTTSASPRR